jgi:flagellar motor protein MotB
LEVVLIEGHTDNVPIIGGQYKNNWQLSSARSLATFEYLLKCNATLGNLRNGSGEMLFGTSAYADTRPAQSNATNEGRKANRRIDLRFILAAPKTGERQ